MPHILEELLAELIVSGGIAIFLYFRARKLKCNHTLKKLHELHGDMVLKWADSEDSSVSKIPQMPEQWVIDFIKENAK